MDNELENAHHLQNDTPHFDALLQPLLQTRPWIMLCAILGFISSGLMIIFGLLFMLGISASMFMTDTNQAEFGGGVAFFMVAVYLVMGIVFALPSLWLFRYARRIRLAQQSREIDDIVSALKFQKSFWKFIGICILIYFVLIVLSLVIVAIGALFSA